MATKPISGNGVLKKPYRNGTRSMPTEGLMNGSFHLNGNGVHVG